MREKDTSSTGIACGAGIKTEVHARLPIESLPFVSYLVRQDLLSLVVDRTDGDPTVSEAGLLSASLNQLVILVFRHSGDLVTIVEFEAAMFDRIHDEFLQRGPKMELSRLHQPHGRPLNEPSHSALDVTRIGAHEKNVLQPFDTRRIIHGGRQRMDRPLQDVRECVLMNRLRHIIEGPRAQPFHRRFDLTCVGEEHDGASRATLANLLHQHDPFLFGQKEIHNHDIGLRHVKGRQPEGGGRCGNHRMPLRLRMLQYHALGIGIVGNDK